MSVVDKKSRWLRFVSQTKRYQNHEVVIGWIEGEGKPRSKEDNPHSSITNAGLAVVHEFGTEDSGGHIPEGRLGLREWVDRSQPTIGKAIDKSYDEVLDGREATQSLERLGLWATEQWKKYQRDVQPGPEWADSTDKAKLKKVGRSRIVSEKKLIVTRQLVNSITHVVRRKGVG